MGIGIHCIRNSEIRCSFSYGMFYEIRSMIAKAYNYEIGRIYENSLPFNKEALKEADRQYIALYKIANEESRMMMRFLAAPDTGGRADAKLCKFILKFKKYFFKKEISKERKKFYYKPFWKVVENGTKYGIKWG